MRYKRWQKVVIIGNTSRHSFHRGDIVTVYTPYKDVFSTLDPNGYWRFILYEDTVPYGMNEDGI